MANARCQKIGKRVNLASGAGKKGQFLLLPSSLGRQTPYGNDQASSGREAEIVVARSHVPLLPVERRTDAEVELTIYDSRTKGLGRVGKMKNGISSARSEHGTIAALEFNDLRVAYSPQCDEQQEKQK